MTLRDLRYLLAYLVPATAGWAMYVGGIVAPAAFVLVFVLVPLVDQFAPVDHGNMSAAEETRKGSAWFFDLLLYVNLPILYLLLWVYLSRMAAGDLSPYEAVGMTLSMGVVLGSVGINVAHEIGHRARWYDQFAARALLLPPLYMHFNIEHNRGHHRRVATPDDPASASRGQNFYHFWVRSVVGSYRHAWSLERQRLEKASLPVFGLRNDMILFTLLQAAYLATIALTFGWSIVPFAVAAAGVAITMLEAVNYIEHYGLRRRQLADGRYERVQPCHAWNSDHQIGRILLYELTRHSDHHLLASRKYQVLRSFGDSPQLPYGYPASMLMAFMPPLWFGVIDRELDRFGARPPNASGAVGLGQTSRDEQVVRRSEAWPITRGGR